MLDGLPNHSQIVVLLRYCLLLFIPHSITEVESKGQPVLDRGYLGKQERFRRLLSGE
jgi:hypothetical protein